MSFIRFRIANAFFHFILDAIKDEMGYIPSCLIFTKLSYTLPKHLNKMCIDNVCAKDMDIQGYLLAAHRINFWARQARIKDERDVTPSANDGLCCLVSECYSPLLLNPRLQIPTVHAMIIYRHASQTARKVTWEHIIPPSTVKEKMQKKMLMRAV